MKIFSTYIKHSVATIKKKQKAITSWRLDLCSTREHKFKGVSKDNLGLLQMWLWDRNYFCPSLFSQFNWKKSIIRVLMKLLWIKVNINYEFDAVLQIFFKNCKLQMGALRKMP